jgi:hypothetical protein
MTARLDPAAFPQALRYEHSDIPPGTTLAVAQRTGARPPALAVAAALAAHSEALVSGAPQTLRGDEAALFTRYHARLERHVTAAVAAPAAVIEDACATAWLICCARSRDARRCLPGCAPWRSTSRGGRPAGRGRDASLDTVASALQVPQARRVVREPRQQLHASYAGSRPQRSDDLRA